LKRPVESEYGQALFSVLGFPILPLTSRRLHPEKDQSKCVGYRSCIGDTYAVHHAQATLALLELYSVEFHAFEIVHVVACVVSYCLWGRHIFLSWFGKRIEPNDGNNSYAAAYLIQISDIARLPQISLLVDCKHIT
jgi:hypothetical protein